MKNNEKCEIQNGPITKSINTSCNLITSNSMCKLDSNTNIQISNKSERKYNQKSIFFNGNFDGINKIALNKLGRTNEATDVLNKRMTSMEMILHERKRINSVEMLNDKTVTKFDIPLAQTMLNASYYSQLKNGIGNYMFSWNDSSKVNT